MEKILFSVYSETPATQYEPLRVIIEITNMLASPIMRNKQKKVNNYEFKKKNKKKKKEN